MKVICARLSSGEEIIGQYIGTAGGLSGVQDPVAGQEPWAPPKCDVIMRKVRVISMQQTQHGIGIGLIPFTLGSADSDVIINAAHVTAMYSAQANLEKGYLQETSGLALASSIQQP